MFLRMTFSNKGLNYASLMASTTEVIICLVLNLFVFLSFGLYFVGFDLDFGLDLPYMG